MFGKMSVEKMGSGKVVDSEDKEMDLENKELDSKDKVLDWKDKVLDSEEKWIKKKIFQCWIMETERKYR